MKISLVGLHFAEYTARLAVALAARHEIQLILSARNARDELTGGLRQQVAHLDNVKYLEMRRWRDPRVLGTSLVVNRMIRAFSPDVVHLQEVHPVFTIGTILLLRRSLPVVLTVHDPVGHSGSMQADTWQHQIFTALRRQATRMIVHGPQMRAEMLAMDRRLPGRVDVIPHGVLGHDDVTPDPAGSEPATFLFFGRIEIYKGLGFLLDALDILKARGRQAKLVVAGTGADLKNHRERIAASGCIELINRFVPAENVSALFRRCTAVVLPYTDATQSGVATIALANSRPVIASNTGDLPDIVHDGRTGLLVPPRDALGLADAMERLIVDEPLRASLAIEAGRYARDRLLWPRLAELTVGTYERALESRQPADKARPLVADDPG